MNIKNFFYRTNKISNKKISIIFFSLFIISIFSFYFVIYSEKYLDLSNKYKLNSLENINKYANFYPELENSLKEYIDLKNIDWQNPSFVKFYKKYLSHTLFKKILIRIGINKTPVFNIYDLESLLDKTTEKNIKNKIINNYNKIINAKEEYRFFIFGDIHANLHSLYRSLAELEKQKIIDHNLKIIPKNTWLIFLGNAIDIGPYSLETLNILLSLINKNENKVLYLKGDHETNGYWKNFNTREQIKTIFPEFVTNINKNNLKNKSLQNKSLQNKIDKYFSTLPEHIIIETDNKNLNNIKENILLSNKEKLELLKNKKSIKFMIISGKEIDSKNKTDGLEFVGYESGSAKWRTIACPSITYKKFFNFHYDAFLELTIGKSAQQSIITLFNRDINRDININLNISANTNNKNNLNYKNINNNKKLEKENTFSLTYYDPIFARKIKKDSPFLSKNIFHIGSTMSLSGINAPFSNENKTGLEASILYNNKEQENLILPIILDDGYSPKNARKNIKKLLDSYSINTVIAPTGTPTLSFYLDMIKNEQIFVFFPITGAASFRDKDLKNIIHFRSSYTEEAKSSINYLVKEHGIKNFAFFYQNDTYGEPIAKTAHEELKKLGINKWLDLPHLRTQPEFKEIASKLKSAMPEAIGCFSTNAPTQELISELGADFFSGRIIFGVSFLYSQALQNFLDDHGIKYLLISVVPNQDYNNLQILNEYKNKMFKIGQKTNANSLEGYMCAELISHAINNIKPPFTGKKLIDFFEKLNKYKFKGLELTFDPEKRDLSQPIFLRTFDNKWINYKY